MVKGSIRVCMKLIWVRNYELQLLQLYFDSLSSLISPPILSRFFDIFTNHLNMSILLIKFRILKSVILYYFLYALTLLA